MGNMSSFQEYAITSSSESQQQAERIEPFISQMETAEAA